MADASLPDALRALHDRPLLVGLSGGMDSTVLLHALATTRTGDGPRLRAIHVHHGLHADADQWTEHCRGLCQSLGVDCVVEPVRVRRDSGKGLEAAARDARYAAFGKHLAEGESLVLAHHQDDQAETVLLRLLRGSGSDGLAAMRGERRFAKGYLLRPLLGVTRATLHDYAQEQSLAWCEDPSNQDPGADRNFLRLRVVPLLRERWPEAAAALSQSAALLADDARLLGEQAEVRLQAVIDPSDPGVLRIPALLALEPAWRARVLRRWLDGRQMPPLRRQAFALIAEQLLSAQPDSEGEYRWSGAVLRRWRDGLHAGWTAAEAPGRWQRPWDGTGRLELPVGGSLRFETMEGADVDSCPLSAQFGACRVASREGGERIRLPGRVHSHTLKHRLQDQGMAPWQRSRMPLLFAGDGELLAAGDLIVSARLDAWCREHGLRLAWQPASAPRGN
jgi:tRNA(Ile)-lysidine synthase